VHFKNDCARSHKLIVVGSFVAVAFKTKYVGSVYFATG